MQDLRGGPPSNGSRPGNCLQACIASLLEVPLELVPHFVELSYEGCWSHGGWHSYRLARQWMRSLLDLDLAYLDLDNDLPVDCGFIASVPSRTGPWGHFIIVDGYLRPVHDPHPGNNGPPYRADEIDHLIGVVLPYDPGPDKQIRLLQWDQTTDVELGIAAISVLDDPVVPV